MLTSNRLLYCKGGSPSKKMQDGGEAGNAWDFKVPKMGTNIASSAMDAVFSMVPKKDIMAGAAKKGLDDVELQQVQNTGSGLGTATKALETASDVAGMIPGPWGMLAKGALKGASFITNKLQGDKQTEVIDQMAMANAEREGDAAQMNARAMLVRDGGLLYKKPNKVLSLFTGGSYEDGGKAPEMPIRLEWKHPFKINIPEGSLEKKKSIRIFKRGGKFNNPDKTNVIVTGSRHHEHNRLGDKGVPVIDKSGEKIFEVEKGELILTKEATNKIEDLFKKYKALEVDEDKAHDVLKSLGEYFTTEMKENLYDYENNAI